MIVPLLDSSLSLTTSSGLPVLVRVSAAGSLRQLLHHRQAGLDKSATTPQEPSGQRVDTSAHTALDLSVRQVVEDGHNIEKFTTKQIVLCSISKVYLLKPIINYSN